MIVWFECWKHIWLFAGVLNAAHYLTQNAEMSKQAVPKVFDLPISIGVLLFLFDSRCPDTDMQYLWVIPMLFTIFKYAVTE